MGPKTVIEFLARTGRGHSHGVTAGRDEQMQVSPVSPVSPEEARSYKLKEFPYAGFLFFLK